MTSQAHYTAISLDFLLMKITTIPERIEIVKRLLKITEDAEFGKKCGMSKSVVNQLKTGKMKSIAPRYAYKLEDDYGVRARWLQLGEGAVMFDPDIKQAEKIMNEMTPARRKDAVKIITPLAQPDGDNGDTPKHATQ